VVSGVVDVALPPGAYGLLYEIGYPPGSADDEDDDFATCGAD